MSTARGSLIPRDASSRANSPSDATDGANARADGMKAGDRTLRHQLETRRVGKHVLDESARPHTECGAQILGKPGRLHGLEQPLPGALEHGVVDVALGREIRVKRGLAHPHARPKVAQREAGEPGGASQRPGGIEDLILRGQVLPSLAINDRITYH